MSQTTYPSLSTPYEFRLKLYPPCSVCDKCDEHESKRECKDDPIGCGLLGAFVDTSDPLPRVSILCETCWVKLQSRGRLVYR